MIMRPIFQQRASATVLGFCLATCIGTPVLAQTVDPTDAPAPEQQGEEIVVTGFRASLQSAQNQKRNADQIVDAIVAEDIGKLPDNSIAEAVQRIPGVQISRRNGEGRGVAIRGLSQVKTLLNGREIFSDTGRDLSLEEVPSEILAGVDVYKNPSAVLIEGGLGGVINLKTRKPLDFTDPVATVSMRMNHYDLVDRVRPQFTGLVGNRFDTGIGEIGVLVGAAYLESANRQDGASVEPFLERYDFADFDGDGVFPGTKPPAAGADADDLVIVPNGGGNNIFTSERKRLSFNGMLQWKPSSSLEFYAEGIYNKYDFKQDAYGYFANRPASGMPREPGSEISYSPDNPNVVQSATFRNVSFTNNAVATDRFAETWQIAGGFNWMPTDKLKVRADIARTESTADSYESSLRIGNSRFRTSEVPGGPTLFLDTTTGIPTLLLTGASADPASYYYIDANKNHERLEGDSTAAFAEFEYAFDGPLKSVQLGTRYADRGVFRQRGTVNFLPGAEAVPITALPGGMTGELFNDDYFGGTDIPNLTGLPIAPFGLARDTAAQCAAFGATVCEPQFDAINTYSQSEKTFAIYGQANFDLNLGGLAIDGNIGGRWVKTKLGVVGFRSGADGTTVPIDQDNNYESFLPSFNLRAKLTEDLFLRFAAAKQLTRPSFADLSPNLTLTVGTQGLQGKAGNPDLKPLRSKSFDLSLEYYLSPSAYVYAAGFYKKVDGFIQVVVNDTEPVSLPDFPTYTTARVSRPQNGDNGTIKGFEIGGQTFFDFLPGLLSGFGIQANYTYVDSKVPGPVIGTTLPLTGLSKHSANGVLFYEKGKFRARVAYNWRDDFLETAQGGGAGALPVFNKSFGTLDASIGYRFNDHLDLSIDASNLTRARLDSYFGFKDRPRASNIFDRRIGIVLRATI